MYMIKDEYERDIRGQACGSCSYCERNDFTDWGVCIMLSTLRKGGIVFVHQCEDTPHAMQCSSFDLNEEE